MTTLIVSPYAPYRDGIANYTVQEVAVRRAAGEDIEVLSPLPSAAHHHLIIGSPSGMWRLRSRVAEFDRLEIHVSPEMLFGGCHSRVERMAVWVGLELVARRVSTELRVHEIEYDTIAADPVLRKVATRALAAVDSITVHTGAERAALQAAAGDGIAPVELVQHGKDFVRRTRQTKAEARSSLGVPDDVFVFLSIGFVQRHKGFDRAVRAFAALPGDHARIYVVGDVRIDDPVLVEYRDELDRLIDATPGAHARRGYVSDEEFDRWLVAADRMVLPYREIWSSSVVERAALFDLPVIATDVGGLADQAKSDTVIVAHDRELATAMATASGVRAAEVVATVVPAGREDMESLMRERAGSSVAIGAHAVGPISLAAPDSERRVSRVLKRVVQRLTSWQLEPVVRRVNELSTSLHAPVGAATEGDESDNTPE